MNIRLSWHVNCLNILVTIFITALILIRQIFGALWFTYLCQVMRSVVTQDKHSENAVWGEMRCYNDVLIEAGVRNVESSIWLKFLPAIRTLNWDVWWHLEDYNEMKRRWSNCFSSAFFPLTDLSFLNLYEMNTNSPTRAL